MLIWLLSAGNFVVGMGAFVVVGLITPVASDLDISNSAAGLMLTAYALAYAVGSPIAVSLTGGLARRRVLLLGMSLFGLGSLLSAASPSIETLLAARVLTAFGAGLFTPITAAVAAVRTPPERRGQALAAVFTGLTIAQVMGVPLGSYLAYGYGWRSSLYLVAAISLPVILGLFWIVPRDLPFQPTRLATLGRTVIDLSAMLPILFTTSFLGAIYMLYTYLQPLLEERMGYGQTGITLVLAVFGIGAVIGNHFGGMLTDRIGAHRTLGLLALSQIVIMPLFVFLPMSSTLLVLLVFIWSVTGWSFIAPQQSRLIAANPDRQGVVLALNAAAIYIGAAFGSVVGGAIIAGPGVVWLGPFAGLAAIGALVHLRFTRPA